MKQLRSTLISLVLALMVGGYIYFNERDPVAQEGSTVLLRTDPNRVQTLQLSAGAVGTQLSRAGQGWQVAKVQNGKTGLAVPADKAAVETLLDSLELLQSNAPIGGGDLNAFGLNKPTKKLDVDGQIIEFGKSPPFDASRIYARVGKQVALLPSSLGQLVKPFDFWRDKHMLRFDSAAVTTFQVQAPALNAAFQKEGDAWNMTQPLAVPADAGAVSSALSALATTPVSKWLDDRGTDRAKWGLDKPVATLRVGDATLTVGKKQNGGYAAQGTGSASVFLLPATTFGAWNKPVDAWRTKTIVAVKNADVTQMVLSARGGSKTLVKNGERWGTSNDVEGENTHSRILDALYWATGLQAEGFIDKPVSPGQYGLDKPEITLVLTANQNTTLKIGRVQDTLYASTGGPTVYELAPDALDTLKNALDTFFPVPEAKNARPSKK